jgi:alginate O-acetyltransferase complex protein AlgI
MLFNSFAFLLVFLPAALLLHLAVERFTPGWRLPALALLSLTFYGYWDWRFVPLIVGSILVNWTIAELFGRTRVALLIPFAIAANLLVLAVFKYFNFFADLANIIPGLWAPRLDVALPLGISFFTFHHVMYLTDLRSGNAPRYDLIRYTLYIAFFPQVLAGPLVRWSEIMHQLDEPPYGRVDAAERFSRGMVLLVIGLAKKVFLGDPLGEYANPLFHAASRGVNLSFLDAWQAALAFTFQIYFDFSGYSDIVLGLALMFGIVLPQNFDAPYRALSLREFWQRWHMTLSRFLRDYLYIPLGGNRRGLPVQLGALFATMTIGGLWHGAGLTFVAWGAAHGLALAAIVVWRRVGPAVPRAQAWPLTFLFVVFTWILFRSETFDAAIRIYKGMLGAHEFAQRFGHELRWPPIAVAAATAIFGPTAWQLAQQIKPTSFAAAACAVCLAMVLLKLGNSQVHQFIYFQF